MKFSQLCATVGALVCVSAWAGDAAAQRRGDDAWVPLGCRDVGFRVDRDTIPVGRQEGRFRAIRLTARGAPVHMIDLTVVYASGEPDRLEVRSEIRPGDRTRPLDLRGRERSIRQIDLVYRARPSFGGRATVCAEGLQDVAGPGGSGGRWVELGCRDVGFRVDRDTIPVGRAEGRFKAIRLRARGNDVYMMDLRVIYAGGDPDDIPVRALIRQGSQSGPLDLRGRERAIRQIDLVYRARPDFRGRATVCIDGLD